MLFKILINILKDLGGVFLIYLIGLVLKPSKKTQSKKPVLYGVDVELHHYPSLDKSNICGWIIV